MSGKDWDLENRFAKMTLAVTAIQEVLIDRGVTSAQELVEKEEELKQKEPFRRLFANLQILCNPPSSMEELDKLIEAMEGVDQNTEEEANES